VARTGASAERAAPVAGALMRVAPIAFAAALGLTGLAGVWRTMAQYYGSPSAVADAISALAAILWLVLVVGYLERIAHDPGIVGAHVRDPVQSPFVMLPLLVLLLLTVTGLAPHAREAARIVFVVALAGSFLLGAVILGQWVVGEVDERRAHPGYLMAALGPGLLGAQGASFFGMRSLGWLCLGLGLLGWLTLGSVIFDRLMFRPTLPVGLLPTMVIEIAPPAVAGTAYLGLRGNRIDPVVLGLAGYGLMMVLMQLRFVPLYRRVPVFPGYWAFTFSWAAVCGLAVRWIAIQHPDSERLWAWLLTAAITAFIVYMVATSLRALAVGELLRPRAAS
jgi:tellurite resistance protein